MTVSNVGINALDRADLRGLLGKVRNGVDGMTKGSAAVSSVSISQDLTNISTSSNIMSRNFVGETGKSRYVEAAMASFQVEKQVALRASQVLAAAAEGMLDASGINRANCGSAAGAAMEMRRVSNKKTLEASQKNLDEIQDSIEQNVEDAMAPKDEDGNPIEGVTDTNSGTESTPPLETVDLPVAEDGSAAAAEDGNALAVEVTTPEITRVPFSPTALADYVSIDIRV